LHVLAVLIQALLHKLRLQRHKCNDVYHCSCTAISWYNKNYNRCGHRCYYEYYHNKGEKGNKYELIKQGAEVDSNHGILTRDIAEITYKGELQNQGTADFAEATKIKIAIFASYPPAAGVQ